MSITRQNNHPDMVEDDTMDMFESAMKEMRAKAYEMTFDIGKLETPKRRPNEDIANMREFSSQRYGMSEQPFDLSRLTLDTTKWNEGKAKRKEQNQRINKALRRTIVMLRIATSRLTRQDKSKDQVLTKGT